MFRIPLLLVVLASPLVAGQVTYTVTSAAAPFQGPQANGDWTASTVTNVPQFDRSLGQLESIVLSGGTGSPSGTISVENITGQSVFFPWLYSIQVGLAGGQAYDVPGFLAAHDGTVDYAGPSGMTAPLSGNFCASFPPGGGCPPSAQGDFGNPALLDTWTGTGTIPISMSFRVFGPMITTPGLVVDVTGVAVTTFTITYTYSDYPSRFCFSPSAGYCPCGGPTSAGCPHSQSALGADLTPSGVSSLSADDFALAASNVPATASCLFFQGSTSTATGAAFGDGNRCAQGSVVRLGVKQAVGGAAAYPAPGDSPISVRGFVPVTGGYRAYQVWYRNVANFCTGAAFNVTSAVATVWTP